MTIEVAVNLLWCEPGRVGGSEEYLVRQLSGIAADDVRLTLHCTPSFARAHADLAARHDAVVTPVDLGPRPVRIAAEHTWLAARGRGADVVHHGGGTAPVVGPRPYVLTVHDLQYLDHPDYVGATKRRYLAAMIPRSARRAAVVATPTQFVRATVIDAYDIDPSRVVVVPHGFAPPLARDPQAPLDVAALRARYGLGDGPLVVYPAITHPHKNHRLLLELMAHHWTDPALRLVLLGGRGSADEAVAAQIDRLGLGGRVVRPGRVPDRDRDDLLRAAAALVFPSEFEGFGAPLVEAMALGTPVVCGDHPAIVEVVGDAAVVLPLDADQWSGALDLVERRRSELVGAGRDRAGRYSVEASGAALAAAYRQAVAA